jgi:transglutaminase-like putative cysteine protease
VLYQITHTTHYTYSQPVTLQPHLLRLRPRSEGWQTLQSFALTVTPEPIAQSQLIDLDGNASIKLWFAPDRTSALDIQAQSQIATYQSDPFSYLLEPWAMQLPIDYPTSLLRQLQPYLSGHAIAGIDPIADQLAQEIYATTNHPTSFLTALNQRLYTTCQYLIRETGEPLPPGLTWTTQQGSCRDVTVLFMEVCRAIGLAARFVSGYQEGDRDQRQRHLHAWAEVYLPGAGWRGYDPTHGLAVSDRHIALAASAMASYTASVTGLVQRSGGVQSTMTYTLDLQRLDHGWG